MVTIALPGLCFTLGIASSLHVTNWIASWLRERTRHRGEVARAAWRELVAADPRVERHDGAGLRPARGDSGDARSRRWRSSARPASCCPACTCVFVLPMCLFWFGAADELADQRRRCLPVSAGRSASLGALAAWLTRLQRIRGRLLVPAVAACARRGVADLDGRLRLDVSQHDPAERAPAHRLRAVRCGRPAQRPAEHRHPAQPARRRSSTPR